MRRISFILCLLSLSLFAFAQDHNHNHNHDHDDGHDHAAHSESHGNECNHAEESHEFDPGNTAFHHIADHNVFSIGPFQLPLPCIFYAPSEGWSVFSSGKFEADAHGVGTKAYDGYVLFEGMAKRVVEPAGFPKELVDLGEHKVYENEVTDAEGKSSKVIFVCHNGQAWKTDNLSTADGGLFGGGITSFYDFSITKNVASMLLVTLFLGWTFIGMAKKYKRTVGQAPSGVQGFFEPMIEFIRDEVAIPFLGNKWERFLPFLLSLFFFILGLNLFGQIPFLGGANVTGNLAVTMVLALLAFIVTNFNGNKHYWEHIFWMPGVPAWVKTILTPVEFLGVFIKPITLMLRLFANITAGHMVMVIFVGLIFIFGRSGESVAGSLGTAVGSTILTLFMMAIELLVAFIQAFVFTILTASYIGAATEEAHH